MDFSKRNETIDVRSDNPIHSYVVHGIDHRVIKLVLHLYHILTNKCIDKVLKITMN